MDKGNEKVWIGNKLVNKYLDVKHLYDILVPKNREYINSLYRYEIFDKDGNISGNFLKMSFNEVVYCYLETRLFDIINVRMDKLINMYEEEYIDEEEVPKLLEITEEIIKNNDDEEFLKYANEFLELVKFAKENKTIVGFLF